MLRIQKTQTAYRRNICYGMSTQGPPCFIPHLYRRVQKTSWAQASKSGPCCHSCFSKILPSPPPQSSPGTLSYPQGLNRAQPHPSTAALLRGRGSLSQTPIQIISSFSQEPPSTWHRLHLTKMSTLEVGLLVWDQSAESWGSSCLQYASAAWGMYWRKGREAQVVTLCQHGPWRPGDRVRGWECLVEWNGKRSSYSLLPQAGASGDILTVPVNLASGTEWSQICQLYQWSLKYSHSEGHCTELHGVRILDPVSCYFETHSRKSPSSKRETTTQ